MTNPATLPSDPCPEWCDPRQCESGRHFGRVTRLAVDDRDDVEITVGLSKLDDQPARTPVDIFATINETSFDASARAILSPSEARAFAELLLAAANNSSSCECPAWCTADHDGHDLRVGFVHTDDSQGYQLGVPGQVPIELQFQLEQFTDAEGTDATVIVLGADRYDEAALRLLATLCMIHADRLRAVQNVEGGR